MRIYTQRLIITDFTPDMAYAVHKGSLDENTRRFLPDEVFETTQIAADVLHDLIACYQGNEGPFVYPMLSEGEYAGYVQLVPTEDGNWEIGYHTVMEHAGKGYATEAVQAFLPVMMEKLGLTQVFGICDAENAASVRVLEKSGFLHVFQGIGAYQGTMKPIVKMIYTK